ncbi:hypothetical protein G7Y89_g7500 [Cudoniella acicularis]|uniref:Uncharacterized protein n=1 Tax=Cudoniella acicularis TaxID=354080 RepID=A0A8H4RK06_9HELO|nr:hypothetical protein G7Y89_g7500 [Cudoniella acicularis]
MGFALLGLDFLMRLVLIEKKVAARYEVSDDESGSDTEAEAEAEAEVDYEDGGSSTAAENYSSSGSEDDEERAISSRPDERTPLITKKYTKEQENEAETARKDLNRYRLPPRNKLPFIYRHLPILLTLQNPRLLTAQLISLTQATILSTFDATVPIEAHALFGFSSLQAGLLFIPFVTPYLLCSPFFGRCVDKYGTRWFAACGFVGFAVPLVLLRVPHAGGVPEIAKLSAILVLCSFGLASISALGIVESSAVLKRFEIVNGEGRSKEVFGKQGPYGQLYAINSMVFSTGLTVGPLVAEMKPYVTSYLQSSFSSPFPPSTSSTTSSSNLTSKMQENIKEQGMRNWVLPNFTTTIINDRVVASVVFMGAMPKYFDYGGKTGCGLPSVTLLGTKQGYETILSKLSKIPNLGPELTQWATLLTAVLKGFILSFDKPKSKEAKYF